MTDDDERAHRERVQREVWLDELGSDTIRSYISDHFPKYALHCYMARFLSRYELYKQIVGVHGSIVECGVGTGFSFFSWYQLSRILDPINRRRIVYGFDTFQGFPHVNDKDGMHGVGEQSIGDLATMRRNIDAMVFFNHSGGQPWQQMELIEGDFLKTVGEFERTHPHLVVALLHLDFDLYDATKKAIEVFLPRMPKGAVIVFDELDHPDWPGETRAAMEMLGMNRLQLRRLPWEPTMSYAVIE